MDVRMGDHTPQSCSRLGLQGGMPVPERGTDIHEAPSQPPLATLFLEEKARQCRLDLWFQLSMAQLFSSHFSSSLALSSYRFLPISLFYPFSYSSCPLFSLYLIRRFSYLLFFLSLSFSFLISLFPSFSSLFIVLPPFSLVSFLFLPPFA